MPAHKKLSPEQEEEIVFLRKKDRKHWTYARLSKKFKVTNPTINVVLRKAGLVRKCKDMRTKEVKVKTENYLDEEKLKPPPKQIIVKRDLPKAIHDTLTETDDDW